MAFYAHSAHLLLQVLDHQNSVKAIVSTQCPTPKYTLGDQKRYLATVINVLAWKDALSQVIANAQVDSLKDGQRAMGLLWKKYCSGQETKTKHLQPQNAKGATKMLLLVLAHDLILSPAKRLSLSATHPAAQFMAANRARLQAELVRLQIKSGKARAEDLRSDAVVEDDQDDGDGSSWYGKSEGQYKRGRWVRVNTRVTTTDQVVQWLQSQGFKEPSTGNIPHENITKKQHFVKQYIKPDAHAGTHPPDLLLLPMEATAFLVASDVYKRGHIILQDAASCWPSWVLLSEEEQQNTGPLHVLDATASPGNKTTHLSALLHAVPSSRDIQLYALERDDRRFSVLVEGLKRARCLSQGKSAPGLVQPLKMDFLATDSTQAPWNTITHMLLDPSCSGSGIVGRLDWLTAKVGANASAAEEQENDDGGGEASEGRHDDETTRLQKLSDVQVRMIEHAFQYPSLTRLVYSTCSIHSIEDEEVVRRALASPHAQGISVRPDPKFVNSNNKRKRSRVVQSRYRWEVVKRDRVLSGWEWRGVGEAHDEIDDAMLRAHPYARIDEDGVQRPVVHPLRTNGFFACAFERAWLGEVEEDQAGEGGEHHAAVAQTTTPTSPTETPQQSARARKRARQKANAALRQGNVEG